MSLLSCRPIKIEEGGAGHTISTLSTMAEENLRRILGVTDNPVIYMFYVSPCCFLARIMSCTQTLLFRGISMSRAAANARTRFLSIVSKEFETISHTSS